MRLFAAFELDNAARAGVASEQQRIRRLLGASGDQKWIAPERMHVTIAFLGNVEEPLLAPVVHVLSTPINFAPFALTFAGLGVFPDRRAPRVIWLGTTTGSEAASGVQRVAAGRLLDAGVELERRPFHPHVTLARWRGAHAADARRVLAADNGREIAAVRVDHVTLFESRQQRDGAAYIAVARAPFSSPVQ
jgi:RNA 2',3'-cyclic 3'-phosphodiesterase